MLEQPRVPETSSPLGARSSDRATKALSATPVPNGGEERGRPRALFLSRLLVGCGTAVPGAVTTFPAAPRVARQATPSSDGRKSDIHQCHGTGDTQAWLQWIAFGRRQGITLVEDAVSSLLTGHRRGATRPPSGAFAH